MEEIMADEADDRNRSRAIVRAASLLKRFGVVGAASVVPEGRSFKPRHHLPRKRAPPRAGRGRPWKRSPPRSRTTLEAIVSRADSVRRETGPAPRRPARRTTSDRALAGPLSSARRAYAAGLAALNAYAQTSKGGQFASLHPKDQDAVLSEMEKNAATAFTPNSSTFFNFCFGHTRSRARFCDPYYGGNANFVGWDLIGYPECVFRWRRRSSAWAWH